MKNTTFKLSDFEAEKMNKEAQKIIRGGGSDSNDPSDPLKTNGGGNG
ncbi:rSAM-modified peptide [Flavobacterium sp. TR2]|nr:rSAM-modified peptide [Flavobacterium sp. TR2]UWY29514.1 rSAM-modified peptide [Flavobacterium sp. TR2]